MACFHEINLVCSLTGGPCQGQDRCAEYIPKEQGDQKIKAGLKFSIRSGKFEDPKRKSLREEY